MITHLNSLCECPVAGFCTRHKIQKNVRQHQLCRGENCTPGASERHWNACERGQLVGADSVAQAGPVENPILFKDSTTQSGVSNGTPQVTLAPKRSGGVGTELKTIFAWFGQYGNGGCGCVKYSQIMDAKGVNWCESHQPEIIEWVMI